MSETNAKRCPGCGQDLVIAKDGVTLCPTEDGVQPNETNDTGLLIERDEIIVINGQKVQNPFSPTSRRVKTLFDRAHDVRFGQLRDAWYPEQKKDWSAA